jgi:virginiamycin B lyase
MWFTECNTAKIGRISPSGQVTEISLPGPSLGGTGLTSTPGQTLWVADPAGSADRLTPAGAVTQLALPGAGSHPNGIAAGPARTIWVTETGTDSIVRITLRLGPELPRAGAPGSRR